MALQDKYQGLINAAQGAGISDLTVAEQDEVLYVTGTAPSESVKKQLWDLYGQIDPEMRSGDLVLNISVAEGAEQVYEVKAGDNLSKIAKNFNTNWKAIFEANRDTLKDPDKIFPGQKLRIPS
jgi:nucleoid-associated protein YgaU